MAPIAPIILAWLAPATALHIAITGSSQGIGLSAAKRLVEAGHTVYHANRNEERSEAACLGAGGGIPMVCDLSNLRSVRRFADELRRSAPSLDVLCLNAAVAPSTKSTLAERTSDGFEECIGVNHIAHFLLAQLLKPHLCSNGGTGRICVTASSVHDPEQPGGAVGGKGGATLGDLSGLGAIAGESDAVMIDGACEYDGSKVYKDSKLANVLFCREAHRRWAADGISIRSFNPGFSMRPLHTQEGWLPSRRVLACRAPTHHVPTRCSQFHPRGFSVRRVRTTGLVRRRLRSLRVSQGLLCQSMWAASGWHS